MIEKNGCARERKKKSAAKLQTIVRGKNVALAPGEMSSILQRVRQEECKTARNDLLATVLDKADAHAAELFEQDIVADLVWALVALTGNVPLTHEQRQTVCRLICCMSSAGNPDLNYELGHRAAKFLARNAHDFPRTCAWGLVWLGKHLPLEEDLNRNLHTRMGRIRATVLPQEAV